jgi:hypothetical protein
MGMIGWPHFRGWQPENITGGRQPAIDVSANGRFIVNGPVEHPAAKTTAATNNPLNPHSLRIVNLPRCRAATLDETLACKKATW